jgi:hypothetical protein
VSNVRKVADNSKVSDFLDGYFSAGELCREFGRIDDIFSGVLELKTARDTATRSLSRQVLFRILQSCQSIDVASINDMTNGRYAYSTLASYAALARVASKAIERLIAATVPAFEIRTTEARRLIDAPYSKELRCQALI